MTLQRIPTGVPGFDEVLLGGLIPRHNYLIVGEVASGKTIFSLQWLLDGRRNNERGLYISLIEPVDSVKRNVRPNFRRAPRGWQEPVDVSSTQAVVSSA